MILESLYSDGFAAYLEDGGAVGLTLGFVDGLANMGGLVGRNSSAGGREDVGLTVPPIEGFDVSTIEGFDDGLGVALGFDDGTADGSDVGAFDGADVGAFDGADDGSADGAGVGAFDGCDDGGAVGSELGLIPNMNCLKREKFRVPRPEAGSHPGAALNPSLQQLEVLVQLFLPLVISITNKLEFE